MIALQDKLVAQFGVKLFSSYINGLILTNRNLGNAAVAAKIVALNSIFHLSQDEMDIVYRSIVSLDSATNYLNFE
jgi:hypothetical protein